MAHSHKGIRYGGRKCKSRTGRPSETRGLRIPAEFVEFVASRVALGDARTFTDYLLGLMREAAKRHGVTL